MQSNALQNRVVIANRYAITTGTAWNAKLTINTKVFLPWQFPDIILTAFKFPDIADYQDATSNNVYWQETKTQTRSMIRCSRLRRIFFFSR